MRAQLIGNLQLLIIGVALTGANVVTSFAAPTSQDRNQSVEQQSSGAMACAFTCFAVAKQFVKPLIEGSVVTEVPSDGGNITSYIEPGIDLNYRPGKGGLREYEPDLVRPRFVPQPDVVMSVPVDPPTMTYSIKGKTYDEVYGALQNTLQLLHPELKSPAWGMTVWQYRPEPTAWTWGPITYIQWVRGQTDLRIVLPEWDPVDKAQADKCQQREWEAMLDALKAHEAGHVEIAKQFNAVLKTALTEENKSNMYKPYEFEIQWKKSFAKAMRVIEARQEAYDKQNNHGAKTGVEFYPCVGD